MRNNLSKFTKAFTSMACFSLILISNNSELAAKYSIDKDEEFNKNKINLQNTNQYVNDPISAFEFEKKNNVLFSLSKKLNLFYVEHNPHIGGRYSVLSEVGMLPAELMGFDPKKFRQYDNLIKNKNFLKNL